MELNGTYDIYDLLNLVLKEVEGQSVKTEEDNRIIRHLTEVQYQLKLKQEKMLREYKNSPHYGKY